MFFSLVDRYHKPAAPAFKEEQVTVQFGQFVLHYSSPSGFHWLLLIPTLIFSPHVCHMLFSYMICTDNLKMEAAGSSEMLKKLPTSTRHYYLGRESTLSVFL
jgi:hypothetical protein